MNFFAGLANDAAVEIVTAFLEAIALLHADDFRQIHAFQTRPRARGGERAIVGNIVAGDEARVLRTLVAQDARETPRVDIGDADDVVAAQVVAERFLRAPVVVETRHVAHDQTGRVNADRILRRRVAAGVADVRMRERDDLPRVGRIGQDFLIAGDGRVEHRLANGFALRADGNAAEEAAVCECKKCFGHHVA